MDSWWTLRRNELLVPVLADVGPGERSGYDCPAVWLRLACDCETEGLPEASESGGPAGRSIAEHYIPRM